MRAPHSRAALFLALLAAAGVHAQEQSRAQGATIVVGLGAEQTDNAFKTSSNEEDETKTYADIDLGYLKSSEAFTTDLLYTSELAHYENDTTDDDSVIQGRGSVAWRALPGRLEFDASHERSEQIQDSRNPDIRNNRQLRDIVSAGPTFIARMSPVDNLVFNGRWYDVSYDDSDREDIANSQNPDSERLQGGVSWEHHLSKTDVLSAGYQYMDTEFDDSTEQFQYQRLFGTYKVELRNSGYELTLGVNSSERDSGDDSDGFLGQAAWHLQDGGHRVRAVAINQLTDSGIGLGGNSLVGGDFNPSDSNYDVVDVVERTSLDLGYGYDRLCERCTIDVSLVYDDQDFETEPRDQEKSGVRGSFGYRLTPTLTASLRAGYSETEYPQDSAGGRTDERTEYSFNLDWRLSRALTARAWLTSDERESDAFGQAYDEVFGGMSVRYKFR